jgi:hypothetical protein
MMSDIFVFKVICAGVSLFGPLIYLNNPRYIRNCLKSSEAGERVGLSEGEVGSGLLSFRKEIPGSSPGTMKWKMLESIKNG